MITGNQPAPYYSGCNHVLMMAVPESAQIILDVGCGEGNLGAALKKIRPDRTIIGIERHADAVVDAATQLDRVFALDIAVDDPPLESASVDCILFGDVLEHLIDPETMLRRFRRFLAPGGVVLSSIPNVQHHSLLEALLSGDFQYAGNGLLDSTHLRFFTGSTILKLFLDAGYEPEFVDAIRLPCPPPLIDTARPLLNYFGLNPGRTADHLGVYQYIVRGRPLQAPDPQPDDELPISFVVCVSNEFILASNLLASPCLAPGTPHQVIALRHPPNAATGLNAGLERAKHDIIVCVHQDVYLPRGWCQRLMQQYRLAEQTFGSIGVAGVYGVGDVNESAERPPAAERIGWVIDREHLLHDGPQLPATVTTLDELLLVLPRGTPLRFDPELGFHLYGADICMQSRERGLAVTALGALCYHNSRSSGLPEPFYASAENFARKWAHCLPVATPCVIIDRDGDVLLPGNSGATPRNEDAVLDSDPQQLAQPAVAHRLPGAHRPVKPSPSRTLTSVIIPCFNQQEFTRHCLQALFQHTRRDWELIVVDNGSTDDTAAYLAGVQDAASVPVTIIRNAENRGFPAAINQGLKEARGEYLVMLNNDAVVTDDWLEQLIGLAAASTENPIGLVGPMSNYATPPQWVEDVPYTDLDAMHLFAARWREEHRGKWFTVPKLSGFCVLMKREVYERLGGLDERFGLGFFDDDDLAERARLAGYSLAVARDLFIHHFGSRSFVGNGIDAGKLLEENAEKFAAKWGAEAPRGRRVELRAWTGACSMAGVAKMGTGTSAALRSQSPFSLSAPSVSLTMIVRDEEKNLPHCLGSVRGIFDEIVVVDTGSTDRTVEIARELGAKVFHFNWINDFAAARNVSLSHATGDYAFWLDGDDVLDPVEREKLRELIERLKHGDDAAYVVRCACDPSPDGSGGDTVVDHIRLFPLRTNVRWTYRVHEQILPALRRANVPVRWTDLTVRHTGYVDQALRARKLERDMKILQAELAERPDDPFILFNLGAIAIERKDWPGALTHLQKSLAGSAPSDSITRKLYALIARAHQMMGNASVALGVCRDGLTFDPDDAELWFRKGVVHRHAGEAAEAEACWRRILELRRPEKFASVDMGIYGHLTRRNLAALAAERGDHDEEARLWNEVLVECPGDREAVAKLRRLEAVAIV